MKEPIQRSPTGSIPECQTAARKPTFPTASTMAVERTCVRVTPAAPPPSPAQPPRHSLPSLTFGVRRHVARLLMRAPFLLLSLLFLTSCAGFRSPPRFALSIAGQFNHHNEREVFRRGAPLVDEPT